MDTLEVVDLENIRVNAQSDGHTHTNIDKTKEPQKDAPCMKNEVDQTRNNHETHKFEVAFHEPLSHTILVPPGKSYDVEMFRIVA